MILETNVNLARHTTIGLGGLARWYALCETVDDLVEGLKWGRSKGLPIHILAGGSNSLISDDGYPGLLLHVQTQGIEFLDHDVCQVQAGVNWDEFVRQATERSLGGITCLSGIPGSVGATPIQNVGAYGEDVSEVITRVDAIERSSLRRVSFSNDECQFSYRQSRFKGVDRDRYVIVSVCFQLTRRDDFSIKYPELQTALNSLEAWKSPSTRVEQLSALRSCVLSIRRRKGMVIDILDPDSKSLGSFFTNPIVSTHKKEELVKRCAEMGISSNPPVFPSGEGFWKLSAAWLIEQSGVKKGMTLRGAAVSTKHVLALTHRHSGQTKDVLELADFVQGRVNESFGINLGIEPDLIGFSD